MFESARLKLTVWYLVIIMTISLLFSFAIYTSINVELSRFERMQIRLQEDKKSGHVIPPPPDNNYAHIGHPDPKVIEDSRERLITALVIINLSILVLAGAAGYFLALRTLRPIKKMVDEQKRFITDASHELRTPITSLRSEIEVALRNKTLSIADAKKLLVSNLEEVVSLQSLSDNLLELAQNGKLVTNDAMQEVLLTSIIKSAVKKVAPLAKKKQITIKNSANDAKMHGVAKRITELFVILLDNAIKYSPEKSTIKIISKIKDKSIEIAVIDEGVGIDKEDLPHIFERFYRASKSRTKNTVSGYGLGLSIAQKIVRAHNGTIAVESATDKGTIFKVVFRLLSENKA